MLRAREIDCQTVRFHGGKMSVYLSNPGLVCAAGSCFEEFMKSLSVGDRSGIVRVECSVAGEDGRKSFYAGTIPDSELAPTGDENDMRVLRILDAALNQIEPAVTKAKALYGAERIGVCIGSCDNGSERSLEAHKAFFSDGAFPASYNLRVQGAEYPAAFTKQKFGVGAVCLAFSTACSSSASAIIKAAELIESGLCDAVIVGGVDVVSDTVLLGFDSLEAVSNGKTNPFSKNRDGITLGEGAAVFVLSKDDVDGAGIVLAGFGESSDAGHMTAPLADGSGAAAAMKRALEYGGLSSSDIDYVNLHGTGTRLNDSMESKGVAEVFGAYNVPASSTKPITGHTLGAAGALEIAACFGAIKMQVLPVHLWDGVQDDELPVLNLVGNNSEKKTKRRIRCCMSNSFAFGGCNVSLIIRSEE